MIGIAAAMGIVLTSMSIPSLWLAREICRAVVPPLREVKTDHFAACHFADEI